MDAFESLRGKLSDGLAVAGIIGLGYVGLPLAHALHQGGLRVLGFDVDPSKIDDLAAGRNYLKHLGDEMTTTLSRSDRFEATTDFGRLGEADFIAVCVPTPLGKQQNPDLSYVIRSAEDIGRTLRAGQLISLESTTYPRTTRDEFLSAILSAAGDRARGLEVGRDFFVAFSPEREDPGRKSHTTRTIPKLVGGLDDKSTELAVMAYSRAVTDVVRVESAEVAESAKLLENIFRAVNIALVNEMKLILEPMGIDIWDVVAAASTKPFGFMPFYPGPGLGGHCIPIDPFYLSWKAREIGLTTRFIELAGEVNHRMPEYVVSRVTRALNDDAKPVRGSKVLICGLAYKPDVDDTRETPAAEIIEQLAHLGADVSYHDPHVPQFPKMRNYRFDMASVELSADRLSQTDCVVIVTDHKAIDWAQLGREARLIVDTRNAMSKVADVRARVVKA
jgi:UDP-N-acetyl-D-glucosamine dehydrogenase